MESIFRRQNPWRDGSTHQFEPHYKRQIFGELLNNLSTPQILGITGSRQVGKSTLMFMLIEHLLQNDTPPENIYYFNLDELSLHKLFTSDEFLFFIQPQKDSLKYIFIDEVQRLSSPGLFLKAIYDLKLNIKLIYSGSSQLEIRSKVKEHLVGRVRNFEIQRINWNESKDFTDSTSFTTTLNNHLVYGSYPAVIKEPNTKEKQLILRDIYQNYIEKDIADFMHIDQVDSFNKLLVLLAQQIGGLLNITKLASTLQTKRDTIIRYLDILEHTYIIKRIYPFYQNYRKEITKTPKLYFLDLGLRNFILKNFLSIDLREDKGALFENFYLLEQLSHDIYGLNSINYWRTTNQTEIDFIIRSDKGLEGVETKFSPIHAKPRSFATFSNHYPEAQLRVVSTQDFY